VFCSNPKNRGWIFFFVCTPFFLFTVNSQHPIPLLKDAHRQKRLDFATTTSMTILKTSFFTDESTFRLFGFKKKVWRPSNAPYVARTVKHPGKVNVWGCFSSKGFGKLVIFTENLNAPLLLKIYNKGLCRQGGFQKRRRDESCKRIMTPNTPQSRPENGERKKTSPTWSGQPNHPILTQLKMFGQS